LGRLSLIEWRAYDPPMRWLAGIGRDARLALRTVRNAPAFALTAILTLALGIGANTAVFSVVNALLFRPLPVNDADHLVVLATSREPSSTLRGLSYPEIVDYGTAASDTLEGRIAGYSVGFVGLTAEGGGPARVLVTWVTGNYFSMLGVTPAAGRLITDDDVRPGHVSPVAVLGYETWRSRFNGDAAIVGRKVFVNGRPCTVVGVARSGFAGAFAFSQSEVYLPLNWSNGNVFADRSARNLHALARVRAGESLDRANAELNVIAERLESQYPETSAGVRVRAIPERFARPEEDNARSNVFGSMIILLLVGLVFLAAEVNVMNLLIARAAARRRELAIRVAIGASRTRLIQQLAVEALVLAAAGGAAGVVVAKWITGALAAIRLPGSLPVRLDFHLDARVLAYAFALTCLTATTVGVLAAFRASRVSVDAALRDRAAGSRRRVGARIVLVVAQTAVCFVLLVAASMFTRSLREARHMDLGFDPRGVLNVQMDVAQVGYTIPRGRALFDEIERRVRRLPGVEGAAYACTVPMGYVSLSTRVAPEGAALDRAYRGAGMNIIGPDYFRVMGTAIVRGRSFDNRDAENAPRVAIVNSQLANLLWPGSDPIGRRFSAGSADSPLLEVIGVAATAKYRLLFEEPQPYYYVPLTQNYSALRVLHIRTSSAPESLAPPVERLVHELEPALPLYDVQSMTSALDGGYGFFLLRTAAVFALVLGSLAAALAVVGLYGVVSCAVTERSREIGIRLALGATAGNIARMVLADSALLAAAGAMMGAAGALGVGRVISRLLFGVAPTDPISFLAAAACLVVVILIAAAAPAARAVAINPIASLRE
jgi:putative ABC transport system permease protein